MTSRLPGCECPRVADFHQNGVITTLHKLGTRDLGRIEAELVAYSAERPIAQFADIAPLLNKST